MELVLHHRPHAGPDGFLDLPVDRHALPDLHSKFPGDVAQRLVAEHLHGALVVGQSIVKRQFIIRQLEPVAAFAGYGSLRDLPDRPVPLLPPNTVTPPAKSSASVAGSGTNATRNPMAASSYVGARSRRTEARSLSGPS